MGAIMLRSLALAVLVSTVTAALGASTSAPSVKRPVDPGVRAGCRGAIARSHLGRGSVLPRWAH
jgi:hypothetical protein